MHVYMHTHTYIFTLCVYINYVCVYIYVYIYTHTHMYVYSIGWYLVYIHHSQITLIKHLSIVDTVTSLSVCSQALAIDIKGK